MTTHFSTDTTQPADLSMLSVSSTPLAKAASGAVSSDTTIRSSASALGMTCFSRTARAQPV
eukprot:12016165-Alexandrium_andersonii.AAC.1